MGAGQSRVKNTRQFEFDPQEYYGTWYEIGRYPDKDEAVCNDITVTIGPQAGNLDNFSIVRQCICDLSGQQLCGQQDRYRANRIGETNEYVTLPERDDEIPRGRFRIVWTDYVTTSLVSDGHQVWIYQRQIQLDREILGQLYTLLIQHGFDPSKIILTGRAITNLVSKQIFTGTLIKPFCYPGDNKFKTPESCEIYN